MKDLENWLSQFEEKWNLAPDWWKIKVMYQMAKICYTDLEAIEGYEIKHKTVLDYTKRLLKGKTFSCRKLGQYIDSPDDNPSCINLSSQSDVLNNPKSIVLSVGVCSFLGTIDILFGKWVNIPRHELIPCFELGYFEAIEETCQQIWSDAPKTINKIQQQVWPEFQITPNPIATLRVIEMIEKNGMMTPNVILDINRIFLENIKDWVYDVPRFDATIKNADSITYLTLERDAYCVSIEVCLHILEIRWIAMLDWSRLTFLYQLAQSCLKWIPKDSSKDLYHLITHLENFLQGQDFSILNFRTNINALAYKNKNTIPQSKVSKNTIKTEQAILDLCRSAERIVSNHLNFDGNQHALFWLGDFQTVRKTLKEISNIDKHGLSEIISPWLENANQGYSLFPEPNNP